MSQPKVIGEKLAKKLVINGVPGEDVAKKGGWFWTLEVKDIEETFNTTRAEAEDVFRTAYSALSKAAAPEVYSPKRFNVDFGYVPVCRSTRIENMSQCFDKSITCRPEYPNRSCFSISTSEGYSKLLPEGNWNPLNYQKLRSWISSLEMVRAESQLALFDCDNTILAGTIGPLVSKEAEIRGLAKWRPGEKPPFLEHYRETHPDFKFDPEKVTPHQWWALLSKFQPQLDADALSMGFAGMTVKEIADCVNWAEQRNPEEFARAYPEMRDLINFLVNKGIHVGVVSSSPYLAVALALKKSGVNVPLHGIEGTDFYVQPQGFKQPVLLSNLVNTQLLKENPNATIDDVIKKYGHLKAMRMVHPVQNGQEGKGAAGTSIAWRSMDIWNKYRRGEKEMPLTLGQMRLVGYFGDNTAPFSDMVGANPVQSGNDQGLVRVLVPENLLILNINRGIDLRNGEIDFVKKGSRTLRFRDFYKQLRLVHSGSIVIEQDGVYKGPLQGTFLQRRIGVIPFFREIYGAQCRLDSGEAYYTTLPDGRKRYKLGKMTCDTPDEKLPKIHVKMVEDGSHRVDDLKTYDIVCSTHKIDLQYNVSCMGRNGFFRFHLVDSPEGFGLKYGAYLAYANTVTPHERSLERFIHKDDPRVEKYWTPASW